MNDGRCHDANLPLENSTRRGEGTRRNRVHNLQEYNPTNWFVCFGRNEAKFTNAFKEPRRPGHLKAKPMAGAACQRHGLPAGIPSAARPDGPASQDGRREKLQSFGGRQRGGSPTRRTDKAVRRPNTTTSHRIYAASVCRALAGVAKLLRQGRGIQYVEL